MKRILQTLEGADGQLSARRLTALVTVLLQIFVIVYDTALQDTDNAVALTWALIAEGLLLFGVITTDNLIKLRWGGK